MKKDLGCGTRIRTWRKEVGLQNQQLAKILGVSQGSLSDIENGKSCPSFITIKAFLEKTEIDWYWMITGKRDYVPTEKPPDPPFVVTLSSQLKEVTIRYDR